MCRLVLLWVRQLDETTEEIEVDENKKQLTFLKFLRKLSAQNAIA